jgi:hypothetical protein
MATREQKRKISGGLTLLSFVLSMFLPTYFGSSGRILLAALSFSGLTCLYVISLTDWIRKGTGFEKTTRWIVSVCVIAIVLCVVTYTLWPESPISVTIGKINEDRAFPVEYHIVNGRHDLRDLDLICVTELVNGGSLIMNDYNGLSHFTELKAGDALDRTCLFPGAPQPPVKSFRAVIIGLRLEFSTGDNTQRYVYTRFRLVRDETGRAWWEHDGREEGEAPRIIQQTMPGIH